MKEKVVASLVSAMGVSHSPFLFTPPEDWRLVRQARDDAGIVRLDVPHDIGDEPSMKYARCHLALAELRDRLEHRNPDVLIVLGHDDEDQFSKRLYSPFTIFACETMSGYRLISFDYDVRKGLPKRNGPGLERLPKNTEHWHEFVGNPALAHDLAYQLINDNFDITVCTELPNPEAGLAHSFTRPLFNLDPEYRIPIIPIAINCTYGPQPLGRRCVEFGRSLRRAITSLPSDIRVAVIAAGGMWHTPGAVGSYVDRAFDREMLGALQGGDPEKAAQFFDSEGSELALKAANKNVWTLGTGRFNGLGNGVGHYRMWLTAAGLAEGNPAELLDYVPIYSSPSALAFADFSVD